MKKSPTLYIIALIALVAGIMAGQLSQKAPPAPTEKIQGVILPEGKSLGDFKLTDNEGKAFTPQSLRNHWSLIFIGYTHCPDICPTTLNILQQVYQLMSEQGLQAPRMVFISVDPERDSIETLNEYVTYFGDGFTGVTGSTEELRKIATQLGVFYEKTAGSSGDIKKDDYLMNHSSSLMLINPEGELQAYITAPHTVANITYAIEHSRAYFQSIRQ